MFCMIWEIHLGMFDAFSKLRACGRHPGRMSRMGVGGRGLIFVSLVFYMFQNILNIFVVFLLCLVGKNNYIHIRGKFLNPSN